MLEHKRPLHQQRACGLEQRVECRVVGSDVEVSPVESNEVRSLLQRLLDCFLQALQRTEVRLEPRAEIRAGCFERSFRLRLPSVEAVSNRDRAELPVACSVEVRVDKSLRRVAEVEACVLLVLRVNVSFEQNLLE